ncbi:MAG: TRAP transporter TatT component family protein [Nitrospinae bacterium]|nr:TRAP transporter TatT component family protein [Nitrospinota bacterium]MDA1108765.1 TRAP transporter TatT component family protein [Nitrospinota bacterium]
MRHISCFILFLTLIFGGCSGEQMAVRAALPLVEGQYASIQEEADPDLAEKAIPANLKMLEGFLKGDEKNLTLLHALSEGFCGYAFSFVEETQPDRASALYLRGRDYALRALEVETGIKRIDKLGLERFKKSLRKMTVKNVPSLFWTGQCWGGWLMLSLDIPNAFADVSKVELLMNLVLELDETYHYAGPHLFLGAFYGSRSKLLGGDPEKARKHFIKSLTLTSSRFLMSRVLYAKTYAVQVQDRNLFEDQLKAVIKTPSDILPEQRLANEVAKIKARRLLKLLGELF